MLSTNYKYDDIKHVTLQENIPIAARRMRGM